MIYPESLQKLIDEFERLPGIGQKTAERLALHINRVPPEQALKLAEAVAEVKKNVRSCSRCNNITEQDPCQICSDQGRDTSKICVVEETKDVVALERTGSFKGVYHVLLGKISPLKGIGPEHIKLDHLLRRIREEDPKEVILATGADIEGEATALYLTKLLKALGVTVSRIAYGLPVGSSLEYANDITIARALEGRKEIS
jgi:recombination protein RecR